MSAPLAELKELTKDQPAAPLRPAQVEAYTEELRRLGALKDSKDMDGKPAPWLGAQNADAARQIRRIHQTLDTQAPKKITGERANRVYAKVEEVLDGVVRPAMLPKSIMHRNPAGAVGHYMRGENSPTVKDAILTVKRAIRALDPENPDPDLTNMERFRPEGGRADGTTSFMPGATIPGFLAMTPQAKANWPEGLSEPQNTALKQAQRGANGAAKPAPRAKRVASPAQLAALERAHAARRAKRAAAQVPVSSTAGED